MKAHFVEFLSPGTFVSETTVKPVDKWDVDAARMAAKDIVERHGAKPYAFRFFTKERGDNDLDSKITSESPKYYLGGKIRTVEEVEADNFPDEKILRSNMRNNGYRRIITSTNGWKWTQPLRDDDVVLEV